MNGTCTKLFCGSLLLAVALPHGAGGATALSSLRGLYEKSAQKIDQEHAAAVNDLKSRYLTSLRNVEESYRRAGNLDMLLATRREIKRFETERRVPREPPATTPDQVIKTQATYHGYLKRAEKTRVDKKIDLVDRYRKRLQGLITELTRQSKIEDAIRVRNEVKRMDFTKAQLLGARTGTRLNITVPPPDPEPEREPKSKDEPEVALEPINNPKPTPKKFDKKKALGDAVKHYEAGLKLFENNEFDGAIVEMQKSLDLQIKVWGGEHLNIAATYASLANAYHAKSNFKKSIEIRKKALAMAKKSLPDDHPMIAADYTNLGASYVAIAEYDDARSAMQKAYQIYLRKYGSAHEKTKRAKERYDQLKLIMNQ